MDRIPRKLDIRPFKAEHAMQLELRPEESEAKENLDLYKQFAYMRYTNGPARSLYYHSKLLYCCGIILMYPGVGSAWIVCDKAIKGFGRECLYYTGKLLDEHIKQHKLHRVQAEIKSSVDCFHKFILRLGFEEEGTMRKYGPDESDYILYSRIT